jgi:nitrogen fixation-related uncharacterized protein
MITWASLILVLVAMSVFWWIDTNKYDEMEKLAERKRKSNEELEKSLPKDSSIH